MKRWVYYNPNPKEMKVGDCAVRACCKATYSTWNQVFADLVEIAYRRKDVLSANAVWGEYLNRNGYVRHEVETYMTERSTVNDFCKTHPYGTYVLGLDGHVVAVEDGKYFDTWDSGDRIPLYYWERLRE